MGLKLIIAALEDSLFSRTHNDMAALAPHITYYRRFSYPDIPNIRLQLHFLLWLHPESSCPAFDAIECEKHKMVRGTDFLSAPVTQEACSQARAGLQDLTDRTSLRDMLKCILSQKFQRTDSIRALPPG